MYIQHKLYTYKRPMAITGVSGSPPQSADHVGGPPRNPTRTNPPHGGTQGLGGPRGLRPGQ